jgi:methylglutaconyl-CoA hydratase
MLQLKKIEIEIKDQTATCWLNQPEIRNALNPLIIEDLIKSFKWLSENNEVTIIVMRGRGESFCTGADVNWMLISGQQGYRKNYLDSKLLANCFRTIYNSGKVVINLIHGHAMGGALGFIGASDFTFAIKNTVFGLPEVRLGLVPSVIAPYLLMKLRQTDLKVKIYTGGKFSAEEALRIGLIDNLCNDMQDMEKKANDMINEIGKASPKALKEAKNLLRILNKDLTRPENIKQTVNTITRMKMSDEARKRMSVFNTKF